jgi:hypothetical protein
LIVGLLFLRGTDSPHDTPVSAREPQDASEATVPAAASKSVHNESPGEQALVEETVPQSPAVATDEFSAIRLEGILYRPSNPSVILNGKMLFKGDTVAGARVISIARDSVTVEVAGKQKVLRLQPKP